MACNRPNCCRRAKAVESQLNMKATAQLQDEITSDFYRDDKSLAELIRKIEDDDKTDQEESDLPD